VKYCCALALIFAASNLQAAEPEDDSDIEEITVVATRSRQLVRDQAVRVEVVPQEELEESQTVAPGDLTNLLNELAGARMDLPSAGLGGTSLRLRGMPGRHAQVLSDGLALSGSQTDSFSLLQVPPIDLGRVEVVKGVASALYGGSALAGVLNLVSRPPDGKSQWLLSQGSLGGSDADLFISRPGTSGGFTFAGSGHYRARRDEDHDGWAELPGYERVTARPRWFIDDGSEHIFATLGFSGERREGGTTGDNRVASGEQFPVTLDTGHIDAGMVGSLTRDDGSIVGGKWYAVHTRHEREFGSDNVEDSITSFAAEATWQVKHGIHEWTLGVAMLYDELSVPDIAGVGYRYTVPGLFAQDEFSPTSWLSVSASGRVDFQDEFGTFVSPRLSALFRLDPDLTLRASFGTGYSPVTPLVDEIEDIGFGSLEPLQSLQAERASSGSLDLKWVLRPLEINLSAFASEIRHPLDAEAAPQPDRVMIVNDREPLKIRGAELLVGCVIGETHLLVNSTYMDATEESPTGGRRAAELMPELSAEIAAIFELEGHGRAGFEISYTGSQEVHDDPYVATTPALLEVNALAEWNFGEFSLFLNAMNLTDEQQQDRSPLLRPAAAPGLGGNPVVDAWAPLVGRYFSIGVRGSF
jgi:outer membrane receptor for ferrienterochelin and colicins